MGNFQGRHALIIAAAPETEYGYIRDFLRQTPQAVIICADGGLRHARALGLMPELMITDRDSCAETAGTEVICLKPEKDDTDTQACLREAIRRGCSEVTIVCATGGRIDHMLAVLSLLEEAQQLGGRCTVLDRQNKVVLHEGRRQKFKMTENYSFFSVVPLDAVLQDVTIEHAKYPLSHATVHRAGFLSVSNEATQSEFIVEIGEGHALIIFSRDAKA